MKIAFAPGIFKPRPLTSDRSFREKSAAFRLAWQSIYLVAITIATIGWIWLLTSIGIELLFS
jgi:hypothetical protein